MEEMLEATYDIYTKEKGKSAIHIPLLEELEKERRRQRCR
ncbi:hypothetical protein GGR98_002077 [Parageobacillus caldoxylosilyticus]|nr:hypothetical protein [Parageobacillus caldoxylosilyticus]